MNTINFFFLNFRYWFWVIMFNQRGLCHSMVCIYEARKQSTHNKPMSLSMYQAEFNHYIWFFEKWGKNTLYALHLYLRLWKNDFIISHIFYLTTGKKPPKKAFLRNILNLVGFKIIAIKCYISWSPAFAMYSLD